ncbi:MAG: ribulokinase, partial [Mesorhizobium sp.]
MPHYLGIDVGTGSARAGVFDHTGNMLASAKRDIEVWREAGDIVEQSSNDIWRAVCAATREAVAQSGVA